MDNLFYKYKIALTTHIPPNHANTDPQITNSQHIPMVMDNYPSSQWCECKPKVEVEGKEYPPKGPMADG